VRGAALLLAALLSGCVPPPPRASSMKILALGDSYTIGEGVAESQRFPAQLAAKLGAPDPEIVARTGWTTFDLQQTMARKQLTGPYDVVTLLIGVNNQFQGRDEKEYASQLADLILQGLALAAGRKQSLYVLSIPDWGVTPFAKRTGADAAKTSAAIDRFNAINRELARQAGANYVEITSLTRQHPELSAPDGLHPSGEMYALWVDRILAAGGGAR
jgi:lysophospholipase L1-like esterase